MGKRIAILGAGQLAKYLVQAAGKLGLSVSVVATSPDDPALQEPCQGIVGQWTPELFLKIFQEHDLVTFENEWISDGLLVQVKEQGLLSKMLPAESSIQKVRTKWDQKQFFIEQGYPTASALSQKKVESKSTADLNQLFPQGVVIKESELAYDGKGVYVFNLKDAESFKTQMNKLTTIKRPWYLEERIFFNQELALVFTRTAKGEFVHLPLVRFESENGICSSVFVQGKNQGILASLETEAVKIARDLSETLDWCGTAAIEFFYSEDKGLLINEVAPRVHNSGHFSLSASRTSQFENHLRAIIGMELGSYETAPFAMMKNLIGQEGARCAIPPESRDDVEAFWYGKKEVRSGRKMGHVNAFGELSDQKNIVEKVNQVVNRWQMSTIG